jgi:hypothetical protein
MADEYRAQIEELERRAEEYAPGVLDALDTYQRSALPAESWQTPPATVRYGTDTVQQAQG